MSGRFEAAAAGRGEESSARRKSRSALRRLAFGARLGGVALHFRGRSDDAIGQPRGCADRRRSERKAQGARLFQHGLRGGRLRQQLFGGQTSIVRPEGEILAQPIDQFLKLGDVHRLPVPPRQARHKALQAWRKPDFGGSGRQNRPQHYGKRPDGRSPLSLPLFASRRSWFRQPVRAESAGAALPPRTVASTCSQASRSSVSPAMMRRKLSRACGRP